LGTKPKEDTMSIETPEMSAEAAREFDHFSVHNAVQAQQACPEGTCEAYRDIFTYRRWRAQGYRVQKGQRGTAVITWLTTTRSDENGDPITVRHAKRTVLFCRHQVAEAE
jgi:hypothetical protein